MDECRAMDIPTLGPDINESRQKFAANKKGTIRFGLAAIKGMGAAAADAIIEERDKNGPYKSIYDVVERVNLQACNRKAMESMALSGGFDSFGIEREQYFGYDNKGYMFLDALIKYGYIYQNEQLQSTQSLFGDFDAVEIAKPQVPQQYEHWSSIDRLNRERELVGIYVSAHPLDDYAVVLRGLCNTMCSELSDKDKLGQKDEITLGGIVTARRTRFTRDNRPCGFVTIEDFDGAGELALFGEDWGRWQGMLIEGSTVFVTAKMVQRFRDSNVKTMRVQDIQYMETVKKNRIEKITISMDSDSLNEDVVSELTSLFNKHPGTAKLYLQIKDSETNQLVTLHARSCAIDIHRDLTSYIEAHPTMAYKIN